MDQVNDPHVYLLRDGERQLAHGGPALIAPDGTRYDVPVRVYEALREVEQALRSGKAVQLKALDPELTVHEAAEVIGMDPDELMSYIRDGEIQQRVTGEVHLVRLADVLEFDRRLERQRAAAMQAMADEERWDEGDPADARR